MRDDKNRRRKKLVKKAIELHTKANNILTKEQKDAVESYTETRYDIQSSFVKKSFFERLQIYGFFSIWNRDIQHKIKIYEKNTYGISISVFRSDL